MHWIFFSIRIREFMLNKIDDVLGFYRIKNSVHVFDYHFLMR